ncbi:nucleotide exchange factor GrpE [Microlunatus elymi]|uniref:Protein GrpE n=1 Tax=Microlunatus elymi TaxID=2596828 RepID=A0A516Q4V0_9ACTN|nr:nucleotide exchange factor GrpE [Microlunatus elymi]QDP98466.1 nucleotide exchange factor GrpE [Microlunatus elymi]
MTDSPNAQRPGDRDPEETGRPTVRDKRRIDPQTYQVRDPAGSTPSTAAAEGVGNGAPAASGVDDQVAESSASAEEIASLKTQLADRTADLQRVQAEYVNYKRRVDRDRDLARKGGVESVLRELLPVLDSLQAARQHEELTGGFKGMADEIEKLAAKHDLESYGAEGDPFDPRIHEALMHAHADGLTGPTCVTILQPGYRIKDQVIRPARVAVAEPDESAPAATPEAGEEAAQDDNNAGTGQ